MQKVELEQRRAALELRFDELNKQKSQLVEELHRLQGEYRLLGELITNYPEEEKGSGSKPRRAKELTHQS